LNHQTAFDQFFVGLAFKQPVYYLASEDIFSIGFASKLIKYLVEPIPIKKQTTDIRAVLNCIKVSREGGTIAIAPEGNRTYSGKTEYMNPAIAGLARTLKLPILLYRIEGGYGVQPRWSDVTRKGKMRAYVSQVISPEEYKDMTNEELFARIEEGLFVDEATVEGEYHHKKRAEYLERAIYVCPYCGLSKWESHGMTATCTTCNRSISYEPNKELRGIGFDFPFRFMADWYEYQKNFVNELDVMEYIHSPLFRDTASLSEVIVYKKKQPLRKEAQLALYGDRIVVDEGSKDELTFHFDDVNALAVLGRNKCNIYHNGKVYQVKSHKRFNALKYVNIYYRYKNIRKGDCDGKFLGL
jgi:1-acyl-sn-glycerol-3-phosphate acyltransferase